MSSELLSTPNNYHKENINIEKNHLSNGFKILPALGCPDELSRFLTHDRGQNTIHQSN